jgi:adhesin/invasin
MTIINNIFTKHYSSRVKVFDFLKKLKKILYAKFLTNRILRLSFALTTVAFLASNANAAITWSDSLLYWETGGSHMFACSVGASSAACTEITETNGAAGTIGLGPISASNPTLRMYRWNYSWAGTIVTTNGIRYWNSGSSDWTTTNWVLSTSVGEATGGEVSSDGKIYLFGTTSCDLDKCKLAIINPDGSVYMDSRLLEPATPSDNLSSADVISDMAIDAEGNAYMLVNNGTNSDYIIRIVPVRNAASSVKLKYNIVKKLSGMDLGNSYGMAFLNGYIYAHYGTGCASSVQMYRIDPLTGAVSTITVSGTSGLTCRYDLASGQTAPVIDGRIYNDVNGNGVLDDGGVGIGGVTVQIYDSAGSFIGEATTNSNGAFSFISRTSSAGLTYYIRVKNPKISGLNAAQTWASASSSINQVIKVCNDGVNDNVESASSGVCYGARANGVDNTSNGITNIANYYSKVIMKTDKEVAHVEFAFTTLSDRSDAPSSYGEALHNFGVKDASGKPIIYLGSGVSADTSSKISSNADADDFDDGMFALINGVETPLQNAVLLRGREYPFIAYVNGTMKDDGCIKRFIGLDSSGNLANTFRPIENNTAASCFRVSSSGRTSTNFTIPSTSGTAIVQTFFRARVISLKDGASFNITASGNAPTHTNSPWAISGEVEDYQILIAGRQIRLNVKSIGDVGTFRYGLSNVDNSGISTNTRNLTTTASDVFVKQPYDGTLHAISAAGQSVKISGTSIPSQFGLVKAQTNCVDYSHGGANMTITFDADGNITIPSSEVQNDSDIVCDIVYGVQPSVEFITKITERAFANDNFNISVKDASNVILRSNQTVSGASNASTGVFQVNAEDTYIFDQIMANGSTSGLGHYSKTISCTNLRDNTAISVGGETPFELNATFGDIIKCEVTNNALRVSTTNSDIVVIPSIQTVNNNSTITVTIRDESGEIINSGGDNVVIFMDATVVMTLANATASPTATRANVTAIDNVNGTYTAYIGSSIAGTANISFGVNNIMGSNTANVTFNPGGYADNKSSIAANPNVTVTGNVSLITVRVADNNSNGINGQSVIVYLTGSNGINATLTNTIDTGTDGIYTANLTSLIEDIYTVTFSVNGVNSLHSANVRFNHNAPCLDDVSCGVDVATSITANPTVLEVNNNSTIKVHLTDKYNNTITNESVNIIILEGDAVISPTSLTSDNRYTAQLTSSSAGVVIVGFEVISIGRSSLNASATFTSGGASGSSSSIEITHPDDPVTSIRVDNRYPYTVTAAIKDNSSTPNPVANALVTFSVNGGIINNSTSNGTSVTCTTNTFGICSITWNSTIAGTFDISANVNGKQISNSPQQRTFTAGSASLVNSIFTVENGTKQVSTSTGFLVNSTIRDIYNNTINATVVFFNVTPSNTSYLASCQTNADGECGFTWRSEIAGTYEIISYLDNDQTKQITNSPQTREFTAAAANPLISYLVVNPNINLTADGSAAFTATAYVRDYNNNSVKNGTAVNFSIGGGALNSPSCITDTSGSCYVSWTSVIAGTFQINATINTNQQITGSGVYRTFQASNVSASNSQMQILEAGPKTADGVDSYTVLVIARDINTNPVPDTTITFNANGGDYAPSCNTNASGRCSITWTSTAAGNFSMSAIAENRNITNSPAPREFIAGSAVGNNSLLTIDKAGPITADNSSTYKVSVYAKDRYNNNVSGAVVTFNAGNGNTYLLPSNACTTNANGECFVNWKSDVVGNFTINATINSELVNASASDKQRGFTFGAPNNTKSYMEITPDPTVIKLTADDSTSFTITAYIKDALGHSVDNAAVSFTTTLGTLSQSGCVSSLPNGNCSVTLKSANAGTAVIHARINGNDILNSPSNATFTAGTATALNSTLEVIGTEPQIVGSGYYIVKVNAKDITGNIVEGASITLGISEGNLTQTLCNTDANGQCNVTWRSQVAGNHTVYALIGGQNVTNSPTHKLFISDEAVGYNSILTINPGIGNPVNADNLSTYTVSVQARDIYNNSVPSTVVTFNAGNGNTYLLPSNACTTDSDGRCFVTWKSDTVGNFTINALINAQAVNAAEAHKWRLFKNANLSGDLSQLYVDPTTPLTANWIDVYQINVKIKDINNVVAPNTVVEFYLQGNTATDIEFSDGINSGISISCTTNINGECPSNITLKSKIAGTYSIAARIDDSGTLIPIGSTNRTFVAGPIHEGNTILTITPDNNVTANGIDHYNLSVKAADFYNNPINATQINFIAGGGSLTNASCYTKENGICEINWTSLIAASYQVNASVANNNAITIQNSGSIKTFVSDNADAQYSNITAIPSNVTTDEYSNVTITLRDAKGNLVTDSSSYTVTIHTSLTGSTFDGGTNSITLNGVNGGVYRAVLRSIKSGTTQVTFSVNAITSTNTANVMFNAGAVCLDNTGACGGANSSITAEPNPQTAGKNSTIIVHLSDKYGNSVTNATNVVVLIKEDNTANANASLYSNGNAVHTGDGNYTVNLISYTAGNVTVGFRVDAVESSLTEIVVFNPDNYNINGNYTTITANPNSTIAGSSSLITVFLADDIGNGVAGQAVNIVVRNGDIGSGTLTSTTDIGGGSYTASLNSTLANNVTVGFRIGAEQSNKTALVEFNAGSGNASHSNITVSPSVLNVGNVSTITVMLLDDYNNPITAGGENVTIVIVNPTTGLELNNGADTNGISLRAIDNGDGTYTAYTTSSISVNANVTFSINGVFPDPIAAQASNTVINRVISFEDYAIDLYVTLNSSVKQAKIGDLIRYTAVIENRGGTRAFDYTLANIIPQGFSYVEGSVFVNGSKSGAVDWNASLKINELDLDIGESATVVYILRVGAGVKQGTYETLAIAYRTPELIISDKISNTALASVEILMNDPLFDESLIFGTVYHDENSNGIQDEGEKGLPGVKLVTVEGYVIITDQFGRYHLLNVLGGEWGMGRNFIIKVDPSSIPKNSKFTTANPLLRRITSGIPVRFDFGVVFTKGDGDNTTDVQAAQRGQK